MVDSSPYIPILPTVSSWWRTVPPWWRACWRRPKWPAGEQTPHPRQPKQRAHNGEHSEVAYRARRTMAEASHGGGGAGERLCASSSEEFPDSPARGVTRMRGYTFHLAQRRF
jgi:hypothetical protein